MGPVFAYVARRSNSSAGKARTLTDDKKTALTPDQHHELSRRFAKGVVSGIPADPDKLVAVLAECFRAEALPLAETILALKDHEFVHALTGLLESHTKHAAACECPMACMSATTAHRIEETVRGNETAAARALLTMVVRSFLEVFANAVKDDGGTFVRATSNRFFHKEYAHVLVAIVSVAGSDRQDADEEEPDGHDVN